MRGVKVYAETVLELCGDKYQQVKWEGYGFSVTIPEGSVPAGTTVSLAVKLISSHGFVLPENQYPVSSFFWVSASQVFEKKVSLHISHCACISSKEEASHFNFITAKCSQEILPYLFKSVQGVFTLHSDIATIRVRHFSIYAETYEGEITNLRRRYVVHEYIQRPSSVRLTWKFRLMILPHLPEFATVCDTRCEFTNAYNLHKSVFGIHTCTCNSMYLQFWKVL